MTANRMEPGTSWGSDTLVALSSSSLIDCRDMMASSPICLLSKITKTKSWLWHLYLSYLNFGAINHLARHGLVRGLPRLKFEKDHLCYVCAMGKSKKQSHKPKSEDTNQEKLYLLHMDLCGPMRVASVNGKKYILIIVDDYSRFTWVKFLASKDEAPDFIIKFLKMIQVRLNATVRNIRTDNGTEFVNQTLRDYYEQVGISHETSVARTPQQNGVVERRNRTLVEAARTMLIFAQAPLFLWAEAIATACYTQNRSIIRRRHGKTPYELLHDRKPDLSYLYVFGALCYPNNDSENLGKFQAKADIGPGLQCMTPATPSSGLVPNPPPLVPFVPPSRHEWDLVFQPVFDEFYSLPTSVASPVPLEEAPTPVESTIETLSLVVCYSLSKSTDNTKNDRILQTSSSTQKKNKVEDHSRIIKSCLNKPICVVEPSGNASVQYSKLNTNYELMCVKCNSSMFDARHELCFLKFVSDMNASSKSKSVKKAKKKEEWKPTGKVFTKIGYNWRPTGRTFTLVGNACPLTRITATNKVPLRELIPL
ncbi:retrovirus-related pol polyprotein from transposon TNT 1-94 [Tanacetum coccineum]|uniref:Retrovirus-related pol polyprotein from transposon TNT 1-94 n=1 Tax=Tanacetum coccineum TaxID=301880 RepID=A0ABQ5GEA3_9ASTR